jgi:PilZ domain
MSIHNRRKHPRFSLRYRIHLKFHSEVGDGESDGITRNLSIGGVLLECPSRIPELCAVYFTIFAEGGQVIWPLAFAGKGKVVRIDPDSTGSGYAIALKCVHPIEFHRVESKDEKDSSLAGAN